MEERKRKREWGIKKAEPPMSSTKTPLCFDFISTAGRDGPRPRPPGRLPSRWPELQLVDECGMVVGKFSLLKFANLTILHVNYAWVNKTVGVCRKIPENTCLRVLIDVSHAARIQRTFVCALFVI